MQLTAEIQSITFFSAETNYVVARVKSKAEPGMVTIVGNMGQLTPGELLELEGEWKEHPKFGRQFMVETFHQTYPATTNGVVRYLASGMIKGVGEVTAKRLVKAYGVGVLDILDNEPEKLLEVDGIGKKTLERIVESWQAHREIRSLMLFLQSHAVPPTYAARIFKHYGAQAVRKLQENPYELPYYIRGIGFKTADDMAMKLGFPRDHPERIEAAIAYVLFSLGEHGHLFYPWDDLANKVEEMLGGIGRESLEKALASLSEKKRVVIEDLPAQGIKQAVFLSHFYRFEKEITARLNALVNHPGTVSVEKVRRLLPELEKSARIQLSPEQREAVLGACENKVFVITGGPGTGKTTITRTVIQALDKLGLKVKLAAPTGRAAKRLSEATGYPASTLHRLLQYTPESGFTHNEEHKIKADVLLVDEVSMLDVQLCVYMLRALPLTCRLVLVGDVNQLPSVGPGNLLADILTSEAVPSVMLSYIFRQAQESYIVLNAHRINEGKLPVGCPRPAPEADFFWVEQENPQKIQSIILQLVRERIPKMYGLDPKRDVQVLSPMHKGDVGTAQLNELLQNTLNPDGRELARGEGKFRVGDRVLQLKNNYDKDVFNGDLGWIKSIDIRDNLLVVDFEGRDVEYDLTELDELALAYAVSVHKSQGSEYPAVIMPVVTQHFLLLQKNLIYTGLTRARRLAVLIGSKKAMLMGLGNRRAERRYTNLRYRLQDAFNRD